jgi:hypothetical protein
MNHLNDDKRADSDRRKRDRRVAIDPNYSGPDCRKGERRVADRRKDPRS